MKIILIFALLFVSCSTNNGQNNNTTSEEKINQNMSIVEKKQDIKKILSQEKIKAISKAKKVLIYQIDEFITDEGLRKNDKKYFAEYEVIKFNEFDKKKTKEIKKLLLDSNNYVDAEFIDKCPFTADIGIEFISKKGVSTNVIVSFQCKKLLCFDGNKDIYKDLKSVEQFTKLVEEIFIPIEIKKN